MIKREDIYTSILVVFIIIVGCAILYVAYYDVGIDTKEYRLGYADAINGNSTVYDLLGGDIDYSGQSSEYYWYKSGYRAGVNDVRSNKTSEILKNRTSVID